MTRSPSDAPAARTRTRSEEQIKAAYKKILERVTEQRKEGRIPVREGDGAWIEALKWCLGGCLNGYHPPECDGRLPTCYVTDEIEAMKTRRGR